MCLYERTGNIQVILSQFSLPFSTSCCAVSSSCQISPTLSLACTEEKGKRYLRTLVVVKPARETAIRFLGSATARPLEADRLRSALLQSALHRLFTRTERCLVRVIEFNMSMFRFVLLCQFSILFEIAVASLFLFCLKLKSGLFKHIFPTVPTITIVWYNKNLVTYPKG